MRQPKHRTVRLIRIAVVVLALLISSWVLSFIWNNGENRSIAQSESPKQCYVISDSQAGRVTLMLNRCTGQTWVLTPKPWRWLSVKKYSDLRTMSQAEWDDYTDRVGVLSEAEMVERYGNEFRQSVEEDR